MIEFQKNTQTNVWRERWTDPISATARGLTSAITVDRHLKVKGIEYDADLTKTLLHRSQHVKKSAQFMKSFSRF